MEETTKSKAENATDISDLTNNEYAAKILDSKIVRFFSNDTSSKIALATAIITLGSFFIRVLDYMRLKGFLSVFSMRLEYANHSASHGFSDFLFQAIMFIGLAVTISLSYISVDSFWFSHELRKAQYAICKTKIRTKLLNFIKDIIKRVPIYICVLLLKCIINLLIWIFSASAEVISSSGVIESVTVLILLSVVEFIIACIMLAINNAKIKSAFKAKQKEQQKTTEEKRVNSLLKKIKIKRPLLVELSLSSVAIFVFLMCTSWYFLGTRQAHQVNSFPIID